MATRPHRPPVLASQAAGTLLTIGQLARRTGVSVRALRHYEQLGLIAAPLRLVSGYRVYDNARISQLYRVLALKALRLPLKDIAAGVGADLDPQALIAQQLVQVRMQLRAQQLLLNRLEEVQAQLQGNPVATTETLLHAIEVTTMFEKYYTDQQREQLKERAATLGAEIGQAQQRWPALLAEVGALYDAGTAPADPRVRALAQEWQALVQQFTGGDAGISASLTRMYQQEPQARQQFGVRPELFAYVRDSLAAS